MTDKKGITFFQDFHAGWVAGIFGTAVGHPFDTIKVRQQVMSTTFQHAVKATYKTQGITGFYRGMLFPLLTMGPSNSIFFGVYGNCMKGLQDNKHHGVLRVDSTHPNFYANVFIAGCVAGFVQVLATCPVEVVKTVLQSDVSGPGWRKHFTPGYSGMTAALKGIVKSRGIPGLYQGLVPFLWRDIPSNGVYMITYEYCHNALLKNFTDTAKIMLSGGIAGVLSWMVVVPFDVIKNRIQADDPNNRRYKNMMHCIMHSYEHHGIKFFFTGTTALCVRAFPVNCVSFYFYEAVLSFYRN